MHIRTRDEGRQHIRELLVEDQVASQLVVIDYQMRFGTAQVRMAGIGGVETRREHRKKGYMRALIEDSLTYMVEQSYDVSMLFGISDFYDKFGYAFCLPEYKAVVQTRDAEEARQHTRPLQQRRLEPQDMASVLELYNESNARRTCSLVRDIEHFPAFSQGSWYGKEADAWVFEDEPGRVVAYAVLDRDRKAVNVVEVEAREDSLFPSVLYALAQAAIERRCGHMTLFAPPDHPFARYVQRFGSEWTIRCDKNGSGMMRITNQQTLVGKILPELLQRVAVHNLAFAGTTTVETDIGTTAFTVSHGTLTVSAAREAGPLLRLSQDRLVQLVCGYRSARDILNDPGVQAEGEVQPVLDLLFPQQHPYVWKADSF